MFWGLPLGVTLGVILFDNDEPMTTFGGHVGGRRIWEYNWDWIWRMLRVIKLLRDMRVKTARILKMQFSGFLPRKADDVC